MNNVINWAVQDVELEHNLIGCGTAAHLTAKLEGYINPQAKLKTKSLNMEVIYNDLQAALNTQYTIKNVIFNYPATIILWSDGTKSVVKVQDGDVYDKEKGFVMAYLKKVLGNDNTFNKIINKWVK